MASYLERVASFLREQSIEAYLVGGCVRDMLLGKESHDIDFVVRGDTVKLARGVADELGGSFVLLNEETDTGRAVVREEGGERIFIDFTRLRGEDIGADLAKRDFTINAMAVDVASLAESPRIIDPYGGQRDLQEGRLRAVSEGIFHDDPLRLLRAVRLAAELDLSIDLLTDALLRRDHALIEEASHERVRDELARILALPKAADSLGYMDSSGLLTAVIPELVPLKGLEQPLPHCYDVFLHSMETVAAMDEIQRVGYKTVDADTRYPVSGILAPFSAQLNAHLDEVIAGGRSRLVVLKLAALLHDVGKPAARTVNAKGRIRFFEHQRKGADIARAVLRRLRFSAREARLIWAIIANHMRPLLLSKREVVTNRAIYRFFRDTGEAGVDVLLLSLADHLATSGPEGLDIAEWERFLDLVHRMLGKYYEERGEVVSPPKLIDGHDLMERFGLEPGPRIKELLEAVREAQAQGEVATREEALAYVREILAGQKRTGLLSGEG